MGTVVASHVHGSVDPCRDGVARLVCHSNWLTTPRRREARSRVAKLAEMAEKIAAAENKAA